jgi:FKBP-type peptidyl-prolyl cis-trans isomerase FkpA
MKKNLLWVLSLVLIAGLGSCAEGPKKTKSGLEYQIISSKKGAKKIKVGDFVTFHLIVKGKNDTVLENTFKKGTPLKDFKIPDPKGDYYFEAMLLFSEGDSAVFKVPNDSVVARQRQQIAKQVDMMKKQIASVDTVKSADDKTKKGIKDNLQQQIDFYTKQMKEEPKDLPKKKYMTCIVKVISVLSEADKKAKDQKDSQETAKKQEKEIEDYAKSNKLEVKKTPSGLYYAITKEGEGDKVQAGDSAKVHYKGQLLNGTVFDTSLEEEAKKQKGLYNKERKYEPIGFIAGTGAMIKGWDEAMLYLNKGAKATLLIPSNLGYGAQGAGGVIPPNAVLRFDIEVTNIKKNAKAK